MAKELGKSPSYEAGQDSHRERLGVERSTYIGSPCRFSPTLPRVVPARACLATLFLSIALHASPGCQTPQPLRAPETFDDVYEQRESLRDSVITLTGRFMGWSGSDCVFPSFAARQATRSDWIFMIDETCLYVTGGNPPGFSAMEDTSAGTQITLDARVRLTRDGQLLLVYVRSTPVSQ